MEGTHIVGRKPFMPQGATPQGLGLELVAPRPYTHPNIQGRTSAELAATAHQANRKSLFHHPLQRTSPSPPTPICNASSLRAMPPPAEQPEPELGASPAPPGHFVHNPGQHTKKSGHFLKDSGQHGTKSGQPSLSSPSLQKVAPLHTTATNKETQRLPADLAFRHCTS